MHAMALNTKKAINFCSFLKSVIIILTLIISDVETVSHVIICSIIIVPLITMEKHKLSNFSCIFYSQTIIAMEFTF